MTANDAPAQREVRLERLHPAELHAAMAEAPVAWVPLGATAATAILQPSRLTWPASCARPAWTC